MRVVAMNTEKIVLFSIPHPGALSVHSGPPIAVGWAMALAAEAIGLAEFDKLAACQVQLVSVETCVTIQAPPVFRVVIENHVLVVFLQFPTFAVKFCAEFMAGNAREIILG
jgi:hypothetical protein